MKRLKDIQDKEKRARKKHKMYTTDKKMVKMDL